MKPTEDPNHKGNSAEYHSGKPCIVKGCKEPAGTWWGPHWCRQHNHERLERIGATLKDMVEKAKLSALVNEAVTNWRATVDGLLRERNAILRASGGKITATKEQHRHSSHWSHQSHKDGSETYQIDL